MKWTIAAVGRIKEKFYKSAIDEYMGRLKHYRPIALLEVAEEKLPSGQDRLPCPANEVQSAPKARRLLPVAPSMPTSKQPAA